MSDTGNVVDAGAEVREQSPPAEPVSPDGSAPPKPEPPISERPDTPRLPDAPGVPGASSASDPPPADNPEPLPPFKDCYEALKSAPDETFGGTIEALGRV